MSTYAIGDLQGCYRSFLALLGRVDFTPGRDRLWLAGDLVNRGPGSLEVLRWMRDNDAHVSAVLGNHDLHLLARAAHAAEPKKKDTLDAVLLAPDRDALLGWLARRPLIHREGKFAMLHAGLLPGWTFGFAEEIAREAEAALRQGRIATLTTAGRARQAAGWSDWLTGDDRLGMALRVFTNLRMVDVRGQGAFDFSSAPGAAPPGLVPWFAARGRHADDPEFIFGHWSALGYHKEGGAVCLDSGCVWGQELTAIRLEDGRVFQQESLDA